MEENKPVTTDTPQTPVAEPKKRERRHVSFVGKEKPGRGPRKGGPQGGNRRQQSDMDQRMIDIRRVTRVVAGGRRFNFSVAIVVGDRNGKVGVGIGKGADTALAIDKAVSNAKKQVVRLPLTKNKSIPREVTAKYASARIIIQPAPGRGLVAGSSIRSVLDLAGITDVNAKILSRSKNKLNNARAAVEALKLITRK